MNTDDVPAPTPAEPPPPQLAKSRGYWLRRLLVCNPFFLCSAALLLLAINRLYNDPNFLNGETQKLLFNFSALQVYEMLLVGTAILLARRRVWYDSALLVVVENGLVLVPFMLISQADLIDNRLGWAVTAAGGLAVAARLGAIKHWYNQFNLPARVIVTCLALLLINVALPRVFRTVIATDYHNWQIPNLLAWYIALPIIAAAANLLPRPTRYGGLNHERHWLPTFVYALWAAGTGVHIWCVAHIAARPFEIVLLAPAIWASAWTLRNRLTDFVVAPSARLQSVMIILALLSPLVALGHPEVFTALVILNVVVFTVLWMRRRDSVMGELALVSLLAAVAGMPLEWNIVVPGTRIEHIGLAAAAYSVIRAIRSRNPEAGLIGALAVGLAIAWLTRSWSVHAGLQLAFVFLLVHSLRWPQGRVADAVIRNAAACAWVIDALLWTRVGWLGDTCYVVAGAVIALSFWGFYFWRQKHRPSLTIPISSGATALSGPANWFIANSSPGLMALVASFLLFALGAALAFTRHRWDRNGNDVSQPVA